MTTPDTTGASAGAAAGGALGNLLAPTKPAATPAPTPAAPQTGTTPTTPATSTTGATSSTQVRSTIAQTGQQPASTDQSFADFSAALAPSTPAPQAPHYTDMYQKMRADAGVPAMEDNVASLEAQKAALQGQMLKFNASEQGGSGTQTGYVGRMTEEQRNVQAQLDSLNLQETAVQTALSTKNNFISTMMSLTEKDYTAASAEYNKEFTQNIQLQNAFTNKQYKDMTMEERVSNDARAKITTISNLVKGSGKSFTDFLNANPSYADSINQTEMAAGLPLGTMSEFARSNPKANIINTTVGVMNGKKVIAFTTQDPDTGMPSVSYMSTGLDSSSKPTATEAKAQSISVIDSILSDTNMKVPGHQDVPYVDANGFMTPEGFKAIKQAAAESGLAGDDFLKQYAENLYEGPSKDYAGYGLSGREVKLLAGSSGATFNVTPTKTN